MVVDAVDADLSQTMWQWQWRWEMSMTAAMITLFGYLLILIGAGLAAATKALQAPIAFLWVVC